MLPVRLSAALKDVRVLAETMPAYAGYTVPWTPGATRGALT